jgi:hypothetical protein
MQSGRLPHHSFMKFAVLFQFFILLNIVAVNGQKQKLPPEGTQYPVSRECSFQKQSGNLIIEKRDSITIYRTDSSEMLTNENYGAAFFLPGWNDKTEDTYAELDSLIALLFQNGLLTSDLLIKAFNKETKFIDHKGDTSDHTMHTDVKSLELWSIRQTEYTKREKGIMSFRVSFTLGEQSKTEALLTIYVFSLILKSDFNPTRHNFKRYLQKARIKCLRYSGFEI